jgi:hypothetical protein
MHNIFLACSYLAHHIPSVAHCVWMPCADARTKNIMQAELHTTLALFGSAFIPETHAAVINSALDR